MLRRRGATAPSSGTIGGGRGRGGDLFPDVSFSSAAAATAITRPVTRGPLDMLNPAGTAGQRGEGALLVTRLLDPLFCSAC